MSDKFTALEYDGLANKSTERELTSEEVSDIELLASAIKAEQDSKTAARTSALAKLSALGLTEEEIAAL
jgi:hypothetical protein